MRTTIADIARLAGVSKATVSRVLNARPDVDPATQQRIQQIMAETGYVPSSHAVDLARGRTRALGVLTPDLRTPWLSELLHGAAEVMQADGYTLSLHPAGDGTGWDRFAARAAAQSFDGVLAVFPADTASELRVLSERGVPVVVVDGRSESTLPAVATDHADGGRRAAEHLLLAGRLRLAMITGPSDHVAVMECAGGFTDRLAATGAVLRAACVTEADGTEQGGYDAAQRLLRARQFFDGLFVHGDAMAAGALRALREAGRSVPGEVAVIGFDDLPLAAYTHPALTTVRVPWPELGGTAARLLLDLIGGDVTPAGPTLLPTSLVVRATTPQVGRIPGQRSRRAAGKPVLPRM
ncbi:LacI family DNA-binding transcriptional regulator [Catellatospora tritici]|uniref:LacI family DNA-binding transcriptional regulator n=1 Tax=Catellatospora tritici TaxID=2851566 RepID=UPI001C2D24E9|nr:LacI family DNA-binding transcriptional regulator [Catellatospora tritici]MBV1850906.1 LacI family transcriptional regulator [Catellatospora tritici]MBV1851159.1 LacI family transcriptional regulator [Catellatospora tritici]